MTVKIVILTIGLLFSSLTNGRYDKYEGSKVERLLTDIDANIESKHFIDDPPGVLIGVKFNLKDGSKLSVYLRRLRHVKQKNFERNWDWEEIKKERIKRIDSD